jgi:Type II CAAX prenyl endopeptidase Rce1-like
MFEGRFCPRCGAPAVAAPPAPSGWPCPRCGTLFLGNFCPRCGLPTAAWSYRAPPTSSGWRSVLSVLWTLALAGFIVFALTDFAGLLYSPAFVVPGIQGIASGRTVNSGLDVDSANWTSNSWGTGSSLAYQPAGGNPGGYLAMTLPSSGARGYWQQSFDVSGSVPYTAAVRIDVEISGGLTLGWLLVSVDGSASVPDPNTAIGAVRFTGPTQWTTTPRFFADANLGNPGTYYLKLAFIANATTGPLNVGFDNIRLVWTTDAGVVLYIPAPAPLVVVRTQDKTAFTAYYGFVAAAILLATGYYLIRGWKDAWNSFRAPLETIGKRLKSHSAWIAIAQVWMAATFFQFVFYFLLILSGITPTTPINITSTNAWVWLFELANAGVYEEIAFRLLLIGVPMALASVVARIVEVRRNGSWNGPGSASRHVAGAWRYLVGGTLRNDSPKEALVAAWALLFASSAIFGLAHAPGWGWWKVIPAMVAGLGFGYLFLRHGIGAAILAHFVNDYALSLSYENVGGDALAILIELLVFGLAVAGAGFFAWYAIDAWTHFSALVARFRPPSHAGPTATPPLTYAPAIPQPMPSPPAPGPTMPPPQLWPPNPAGLGTATAVRNPGRIPREYTPTYVPPPYGYPPVRFQCPYCGWVEARYDSGRFTCTRCGRTA